MGASAMTSPGHHTSSKADSSPAGLSASRPRPVSPCKASGIIRGSLDGLWTSGSRPVLPVGCHPRPPQQQLNNTNAARSPEPQGDHLSLQANAHHLLQAVQLQAIQQHLMVPGASSSSSSSSEAELSQQLHAAAEALLRRMQASTSQKPDSTSCSQSVLRRSAVLSADAAPQKSATAAGVAHWCSLQPAAAGMSGPAVHVMACKGDTQASAAKHASSISFRRQQIISHHRLAAWKGNRHRWSPGIKIPDPCRVSSVGGSGTPGAAVVAGSAVAGQQWRSVAPSFSWNAAWKHGLLTPKKGSVEKHSNSRILSAFSSCKGPYQTPSPLISPSSSQPPRNRSRGGSGASASPWDAAEQAEALLAATQAAAAAAAGTVCMPGTCTSSRHGY